MAGRALLLTWKCCCWLQHIQPADPYEQEMELRALPEPVTQEDDPACNSDDGELVNMGSRRASQRSNPSVLDSPAVTARTHRRKAATGIL